jgi:hypothetical protein
MIPKTNAELDNNKKYQEFNNKYIFGSTLTPYRFYKRYPKRSRQPDKVIMNYVYQSRHTHWKTAKVQALKLEKQGYRARVYETTEAQREMTRGPKDHRYTWYVYVLKLQKNK